MSRRPLRCRGCGREWGAHVGRGRTPRYGPCCGGPRLLACWVEGSLHDHLRREAHSLGVSLSLYVGDLLRDAVQRELRER